MIFEQLNPHACRTYLLGDEKSREAALIDPVLEGLDDYLKVLDKHKIRLTHVIDTHTHADHISGGAALKDIVGCEYAMHVKAPARCVTFHLTDGFDFHLGKISIKIMTTPGHTKDSLTLVLPDRVLTGDVLFLTTQVRGGRIYQAAIPVNIGTACNGFSGFPIT